MHLKISSARMAAILSMERWVKIATIVREEHVYILREHHIILREHPNIHNKRWMHAVDRWTKECVTW